MNFRKMIAPLYTTKYRRPALMGDDSAPDTISAQDAFAQAVAAEGGPPTHADQFTPGGSCSPGACYWTGGWGDWNPIDLMNPTWLGHVYASIQAMQIDSAWYNGTCAPSPPSTGARIEQTVLKTAYNVDPEPISKTIIAVIGAITNIFAAHHAAAVAAEMSARCAATGATNQSLAQISQALQAGEITPAEASDALDVVMSNYSEIVSATYSTSPYCNATCALKAIVHAIVIYWKSQYAAMTAADEAAAAAAPASGDVVSQAVTGAESLLMQQAIPGFPNWALALGAGALLFAFTGRGN